MVRHVRASRVSRQPAAWLNACNPPAKRAIPLLAFLVLCVACLHFWLRLPLDRKEAQPQASEDQVSPQLHAASWECMQPGSCSNAAARYGDATFAYGPSRGFYSRDCQWREVNFEDERATIYEYWHAAANAWTTEQPRACTIQVCISCLRPSRNLFPQKCNRDSRQAATAYCVRRRRRCPRDYVWNKSSDRRIAMNTPATAVEPQGTHMLMKNLWYNNGRCVATCS